MYQNITFFPFLQRSDSSSTSTVLLSGTRRLPHIYLIPPAAGSNPFRQDRRLQTPRNLPTAAPLHLLRRFSSTPLWSSANFSFDNFPQIFPFLTSVVLPTKSSLPGPLGALSNIVSGASNGRVMSPVLISTMNSDGCFYSIERHSLNEPEDC